jgi:hypothetical protein
LVLTAILGLVMAPFLAVVVASQPNQGDVVYEVTLSSPARSTSFTVTETVGPGQNASYSDLMIQLVGLQQNLTYSRVVNASADFFPYFPALPNQTFGYSNSTAGFSVSATFSGATGGTMEFGGRSYQMQTYSFSFTARFTNQTHVGNGSVTVFPSTLVYGASAEVDGNYTARVLLQSTDLPLSVAPKGDPIAAYSAIGVGAAAMVAVPLFVRHRRQNPQAGENKPLYWVD